MDTIKISTNNWLIVMEDFQIKEIEKILVREKELAEKLDTLDKSDTKAQLDIFIESQRLSGKFDGIHLVMEELKRLAKTS